MNKSIFKPIIGGIFFGAFMFFCGPLLLIVLLLKFIFTPFGMGRMMMANYGGYGPMRMGMPPGAFADKIRGMSDEEYEQFKNNWSARFQDGHYGYRRGQAPFSSPSQQA
ncbi:MAG: hypothetical protein IT269_05215 [Saprospiraceae bacterium]|nr:hypothetical protein [Saprospiraceae bacterium]